MKPMLAKPRISIAHVEGSGTALIDPNSPSRSPLSPSVKKRVFGSPLLPPEPKTSDQSPYIKSQAHAGWALIRSRYDDGGYSGGSTDRPDQRPAVAHPR